MKLTLELASHAEAIRDEATRLIAKNVALTREELEESADLLRMEAARLVGLAKFLPPRMSPGSRSN